jgi:hypothetical protein
MNFIQTTGHCDSVMRAAQNLVSTKKIMEDQGRKYALALLELGRIPSPEKDIIAKAAKALDLDLARINSQIEQLKDYQFSV